MHQSIELFHNNHLFVLFVVSLYYSVPDIWTELRVVEKIMYRKYVFVFLVFILIMHTNCRFNYMSLILSVAFYGECVLCCLHCVAQTIFVEFQRYAWLSSTYAILCVFLFSNSLYFCFGNASFDRCPMFYVTSCILLYMYIFVRNVYYIVLFCIGG